MIAIKPECADNAIQMLNTQARCLGDVGDDIYYVLDGHAWRVTRTHFPENGYEVVIRYPVIARSEDSLETDHIIRMMRERAVRDAERATQLA
jgi:hypothetical protein